MMPHKSVLSPRGDSTACMFQLPKPLTEEQTRAAYCILTFDEPLLQSDGCKETENGICMADFVVHIKDTQANGEEEVGSVTLKTLPKQLGIGQSYLKKGKLGVFALKDLPHPCFFGPFFGRNRPTVECSLSDRCCVKVLEQAYKAANIDTTQEKGNWMTFIKFTNVVKCTNLTAFIHGESIYYKTTTPIKRFEELVLNTTCDQHYSSSSILLKTMFE
ncbi:PR domain zinc finger protein 2-like [Penaeus indicus]|uniref:PR domain zinc finger protein 2-like n=1 Tax=Penaeus indicus TaxID=29960 RepID=UPI00300D12BE